MKRLEELSFMGYQRKDGRLGIRNRVLVIYTVKCAEFVAQKIVERADHLDVELIGFPGCTDNQYAVNMLISMIRHPNIGAVLAVGLGCEYIQPEWLADIATKEGKLSHWMFIQKEGGTQSTIEKGLAWVEWALKQLQDTPRAEMRLKDLVIGAIIGGCAPAFAEVFMEALADAAVMYGIPRATAYPLVSKMLEGTAALQLASGKHPAAMKDDVCSPGGATIRGIASLEEHGFRGAVIDAVKAIQGE